ERAPPATDRTGDSAVSHRPSGRPLPPARPVHGRAAQASAVGTPPVAVPHPGRGPPAEARGRALRGGSRGRQEAVRALPWRPGGASVPGWPGVCTVDESPRPVQDGDGTGPDGGPARLRPVRAPDTTRWYPARRRARPGAARPTPRTRHPDGIRQLP